MPVSDQNLDPKVLKETLNLFYQVIADLKTPKETETFLEDLLSSGELITLAKRLAIAYRLKNNQGYEKIKNDLKISSATIAKIERQLKNSPGFKIASEKINAERWAEEWEKRLKNLFKRN